MVEEGDNKGAERLQKDTEVVLLFVSLRSCLRSEACQLKNEQ
jgi:hypothetical protein